MNNWKDLIEAANESIFERYSKSFGVNYTDLALSLIRDDPNEGAKLPYELLIKACEALDRVKPSLNAAFEDAFDLYYMNVLADVDDTLNEIKSALENVKCAM